MFMKDFSNICKESIHPIIHTDEIQVIWIKFQWSSKMKRNFQNVSMGNKEIAFFLYIFVA